MFATIKSRWWTQRQKSFVCLHTWYHIVLYWSTILRCRHSPQSNDCLCFLCAIRNEIIAPNHILLWFVNHGHWPRLFTNVGFMYISLEFYANSFSVQSIGGRESGHWEYTPINVALGEQNAMSLSISEDCVGHYCACLCVTRHVIQSQLVVERQHQTNLPLSLSQANTPKRASAKQDPKMSKFK